jgi:hypothetical protein
MMPTNIHIASAIAIFVSIEFSVVIPFDAYRSSPGHLHIPPSRRNGVGKFPLSNAQGGHDDDGIALLSSLAGRDGRVNGGGGDGEYDSDAIRRKIAALETAFRDDPDVDIACDENDSRSSSSSSSLMRFVPLLGLYEVRAVLSSNVDDNPVGGKWTRNDGLVQRLFRTRVAHQHLLPANSTGLSRLADEAAATATATTTTAVAEALNVVSLDALDGAFRITVVLRGDAFPLARDERRIANANRTATNDIASLASSDAPPPPLTNLAVRAVFDPPRIFLGRRMLRRRRRRMRMRWAGGDDGGGGGDDDDGGGCEYSYLPLIVGPSSSVVLDTTYRDEHVRIGRGGRSGTCFVFATISSTTMTTEDERDELGRALEYEALMKLPVKKWGPICKSGMALAASLYVASGCGARFDVLASSRYRAMIVNSRISTIVSTFAHARLIALSGIAFRVIGGMSSVVSGIILSLLLFSGGGIERDDASRSGRIRPPSNG